MTRDACIFIMAGGSGERFWPLSRTHTPKHLLRLLGERTLLEETVERVRGLVPEERIFVLTNRAQAEAAKNLLGFLPSENIIAEPVKRDTAPACALATAVTSRWGSKSVCAVLPADAMIHDVETFRSQLLAMLDAAERKDAILTFGIPPTYPSTAFGYLELSQPVSEASQDQPVDVIRFVEKPDAQTAKGYVVSGRFMWNAGIFSWRADWFLSEARRLEPVLAEFIENFPHTGDPTGFLESKFCTLPKISVDYAILEKTKRVIAIRAKFDWDDVGSWTALPAHLPQDADQNCTRGQVVLVESKNNIVFSSGRVIALCGVNDLVVVETNDALLVCHRDAAQKIKQIQPMLPEALR